MTRLQFIALLTPAVGSFVLVILAWLHQNQRLTDLRSDTNRQFGEFRSDTNRQFSEFRSDTNRQFSELRSDTNRQFDDVKKTLATLTSDYHNFYGLEQKLEGRVDELSKRVA